MERTYTLYKHTAPNGKVYIGATKNIGSRFGTGGKGYSHQPFWKAIEEYGWENIRHDIIATGLSAEEAEDLEAVVIAEHKATDPEFGYNVKSFGISPNSKPMQGKAYKRICNLNQSKEHREAVKQANFRKLGLPADHQSRREKIEYNKAHKRRYVCFETGEVFETAEEAGEKHGIAANNIRDVCRKRYTTAGGFHWLYESELASYVPPKGVRPANRRVTNIETGEVFPSGKEAAKKYRVSQSAISYAARNENAKCCGCHWKFTDGEWKSQTNEP